MPKSLELTSCTRNTRIRVFFAAASLLTVLSTGCSKIRDRYGETCKTRAYVKTVVADYLSTRFSSRAPVRLGIVPFDTEANLTARSMSQPGLGEQVIFKLQAELLDKQLFPLVEILGRRDWPRKFEEFFAGNFGALERARAAGYDLVLVGKIRSMTSVDTMVADVKLIETETGTTIWYGTTTTRTRRQEFDRYEDSWGGESRDLADLYFEPLLQELAGCVADALAKE